LGDNEGFEAFYEVDGLADDMIYGIQADAYGNLWMSTNQGITKYNRLSGKFKNYSQEAGLYISEFNMGAYCKDQDGRLYFGGIDGFTVFDPRKIRDNEYIPPVTITDFLLFNRSVDIRGKTSGNDILTLDKNISFTNSLTLDHNDYIFSFEFSALTFWHSDKNKYQYKLEGFDKEWITTDSRHRRATYTNIPPGEYTFMVRASNSDGYWSKKPAAIDVRIVPPFWKTKTFLGLIILAFIVIVIGTFQYRTYQIKTRNKLLEEKVKERTKEIQAQTEELKKLSIVASKTDNAIAITDPDGNFEWINDGFTRLYGWTIEELVTEFNGSLINFSSADNIEQFIDNCVKRGESVRYETKSTTKAKNLIYSQTTLTPIFDDRGVIKKLIAIDTDITDLEKAREEAEQANKAKSEFLANMSHEIRTPLNGIIGFTDLLMEMDLNDTQFEYMETVNNSANALLGLINDILDFSKIEAGKLELNEEKTDIIEMSENTVDMFKNRAHEKELELLLNLSPDIPRYVYVDSVRLRQILVNLVGNAVKFTREGEVEYKIETGQAEKKGEMTFTFSVLDTGIGVSKSKQNKIFDSFTQADASTTRKYGGTGLGLSISNRLLNKMGSKLEIESEPGAGSRFYFTVTLKIAEKAKVGNGNFDLDKILIADHNQKNQKILSRILQKLDLNTDQAAKGSEVLAFIEEKGPYDLLFLDHQMPDIDGLKVIKIIRQEMQLTADQQPIVLLHNSSVTNNIRKKCKKLDVLMSMVKPVKMTRLFPLLDEMGNGKKPDKKTQKEASFSGADNYFKASYKILIAEDNKTNMLFATTVVKKLLPNAEILEAKNGKKAVNLYKEHSNDLDMIFMDIQMPEMNGYQVTRTIRAMEETGKIPIIALTAGTVKGEREKCEKAGMDDFISKPVKAEIVKETIIKWLSDIPTEEKAVKISEGISEKVNNVKNELQAYPVFDYEDLSNRLMEDRELIEELVASTIDEFPAQIDNLKELLKNGHGEKIELQAHSIKGSASNISAKALTLVALKIEKASENNQFELAKELVPELERQFQVLKNKVKKKISQEY
jgi:PAS domain S-box-containing protein